MEPNIAPNGAWTIDDPNTPEHRFDRPLCSAIEHIVRERGITSVLDLGCGLGHYQLALSAVTKCHGFDGNPHTSMLTEGRCGMLDLSVPVKLALYDMVLSLEVGEHIPPAHEAVYLDNLVRHTYRWVVLSWAVEGQGGLGHVNERSNEYIIEQMYKRGFHMDPHITIALRTAATLPWFKNTVMVFHKNSEKA